MSKKNNLAKQKKQHEFDLESEISALLVYFSQMPLLPFLPSSFPHVLCTSSVFYAFCVCSYNQEKRKKEKKLQAKNNNMKVDGSALKRRNKGRFRVGKVKTKLSNLAKAKAGQAMEMSK